MTQEQHILELTRTIDNTARNIARTHTSIKLEQLRAEAAKDREINTRKLESTLHINTLINNYTR